MSQTMQQIGKIPPQAIDIEEAVLGALMLEKNAYDTIADILRPEMFYKDAHQKLFKAISQLKHNNEPADIMSVTNKLKQQQLLEAVGGAYYVTMLTSRISSSANIEYHTSIIYQKHIARQIIQISSQLTTDAFNDQTDVFELLSNAQLILSNLSGFERANVKHITEVLPRLLKQIDKNLQNDNTITGLPSGFTFYDNWSRGLQQTDLVIIAGETSNGKTSLALNIASNAAAASYRVAIYSYEMSDLQLVARLLAPESFVSGKEMLYSRLSDENIQKVNEGINKLAQRNIFIDDLQSSEYAYLERSIRSMVTREKIQLVVIDYLQLIRNNQKGMSKADQVAEIANNLKNLAKTLNIPIILISQLSRDKNNPKPSLSRLKGSGDIENAADVVWFVWQPDIYGFDDFQANLKTYTSLGNSHHIIAKGRNIGTTEFVLGFTKPYTLFTNKIVEAQNPY